MTTIRAAAQRDGVWKRDREEALGSELRRAPLLERDDHDAPSVFRPENMLREARRQKGLAPSPVPRICILDPDGDMVAHQRSRQRARPSPGWGCFHTRLWEWDESGETFAIVGSAVGGSFAVLVAEQLFASGCELLVSVASAGQILDAGRPPYHILIDRALRDEGTSYHYLPPSPYSRADPELIALASDAVSGGDRTVHRGTTWTTDAPFRETAETVAARRAAGILAVEMEAASLYAFSEASGHPVLCLAHVTNQLGCVEGDFEKGDGNGAACSLNLVRRIATAWLRAKEQRAEEIGSLVALPR